MSLVVRVVLLDHVVLCSRSGVAQRILDIYIDFKNGLIFQEIYRPILLSWCKLFKCPIAYPSSCLMDVGLIFVRFTKCDVTFTIIDKKLGFASF